MPQQHSPGRRTPEQSRTEILDAAEAALWDVPLAQLTVGTLMERTRLGRSSFYVHFRDTGDLTAALLERLEGQLWQAASRWTSADGGQAALDAALGAVVDVWHRHGPVLRAIVEASFTDPRLDQLWRGGVIDRFADAVADGIRQLPDRPRTDPDELATALLLLNERYLMDRLGTQPQADPKLVVNTLSTLWHRTLYGTDPHD
jgi:TetR/AcrR family transcriptional regulator, ethionamide resistance regulator